MEYLHIFRLESETNQFVESELFESKSKEGWRHYLTVAVNRDSKIFGQGLAMPKEMKDIEWHYYFKRRKKFLGIF